MDKTKILIIGAGHQSRWLASVLEQHPALFDIECRSIDDVIRGHKMHQVIENDLLLTCDFTDIENRVLASMVKDGVAGLETIYNDTDIKLSVVEAHQMLMPLRTIKPGLAYWAPGTGADHTSRKREPKGPRGRWGKPK